MRAGDIEPDLPRVSIRSSRTRDGRSDHRFSWSCPRCGTRLPPFKAVTVDAVETVKPALAGASVFFLDRLSRAASPWPPRRLRAGQWWCSSLPARRATSSWRKRSHSLTSSSTPPIVSPALAASWEETAPRAPGRATTGATGLPSEEAGKDTFVVIGARDRKTYKNNGLTVPLR